MPSLTVRVNICAYTWLFSNHRHGENQVQPPPPPYYTTTVYQKIQHTTSVQNGTIYAEVWKGNYGIPQAGNISQNIRGIHISPYLYETVSTTVEIWTHRNRPTNFMLAVDYFGVKCTRTKKLFASNNPWNKCTKWQQIVRAIIIIIHN